MHRRAVARAGHLLSLVIATLGGSGVLDGRMVVTLALDGVAAAPAATATIVAHALGRWIPAMCGKLAFILLRRTRRKPLTLRPMLAARRRLGADLPVARRED